MKDIDGRFQYKDQTYRLVFNLNVMEIIQDKYGSIAAWGEKTDAATEPDAKAVKFGFAAMLNEGIDMDNEENGTSIPHLTMSQVGRLITKIGMDNAAAELNNVVVASTESTEKNV